MRAPPAALLLLVLVSCAHIAPSGGSSEDAQAVATAFFQRMRWLDLRGVGNLLTAPQRPGFKARVAAEHLDEHLKVTEFELKEVQRKPDGLTATAQGDLSWYLEPSVTLVRSAVTLHLTWQGSTFLIDSIEGGPVELSPLAEVEADAGVAP